MRKNVFDHSLIKGFRLAADKTQQNCADYCGIAYQQWQRWESGQTIPSADVLGTIADCLDIEITDLYTTSEQFRSRNGLDK